MKFLPRLLAAILLVPWGLPAQRLSRPPTHVQFPYLHQDFTVLFQGDSITDGGRQRSGPDQGHTMGQDYAYILAAEIGTDIPERNIKFLNRGSGGERVVDLAARWQQDALALKPDILSILIGSNDLFGGRELLTRYEFEASYDKLLAQTVAALPNTKIVIGEPFLLPVGRYQAGYNEEMKELKTRQAAVDRLGAKYHVPVVHYQQAFDDAQMKAPANYWSWDGLHPTYAGAGLMAREWMHVTASAWPN